MANERVTIEGKTVEASMAEGASAKVELDRFLQLLAPPVLSTAGTVLPEGVRLIYSTRTMTILIWELGPQVHRVKWITTGSKAPFKMPGQEVSYGFRRLALPYVVIVAVFARMPGGRLVLTGRNEAYFRNETIKRGDDRLCYPALLNISKFPRTEAAARPLAWICTQYTDLGALAAIRDDNERLRRSLLELKRTMLESGFNYSSEHHELTSYWTLSSRRIPEVADLDRWEALSRKQPLFPLEVAWLPARIGRKALTLDGLAGRIIAQGGAGNRPIATSADVARLVFNGSPRRPRK